MIKIVSWNVNGIRAAEKKGLVKIIAAEKPDILCLQETKAHPSQLSDALTDPVGYSSYWSSAEKKGYSGVALFSREQPRSVDLLGDARFDSEGRVLIAEYPDFVLITAYFPNSRDGGARLAYKLEFCRTIQKKCDEIVASGKDIVINGDFNVAHRPIDLEHPEANENSAGYLPAERAWMDGFTEAGYRDTFRMFNLDPKNYTWWSYMNRAREKNVGWRIDYHCVNERFVSRVAGASIRPDIIGSDHCPVELTLKQG